RLPDPRNQRRTGLLPRAVGQPSRHGAGDHPMHMSYWRFAAMIATSTVVMFGLMYLNAYALAHGYWSETRAWMALVMGATMSVIMLSYMLPMYRTRAINIG